MLYYKGFDKDLKCRNFQYQEGITYSYSDGNIVLCSRGFHFCATLKQTFSHYANNGKNKFAIVEVPDEAKKLIGSDKGCSDTIKIVKVLTENEINTILIDEQRDYFDKNVYCLDIVKELQSKYHLIIGGSVSLYLMGYPLNRKEKEIDFDIIMPYYQKLEMENSEIISDIEEFDGKSSGNDYTSTFALTTKDGRFLKLDVRIDNKTKYDVISYKDTKYKVCDLMTILEAKCRYAMEGNSKHKKDILGILNKSTNIKEEQKPEITNDFTLF